ncbi:hypothetical protein SEUCBS140593_002271 [Sporothrix eucalyptigena]|uniref:Carboxylic ester hydrolase n=1 Tax=Sporothrix eucalyptigena TaxID=1812306 RepID=A0ABP0B542_9PEZI
MASRNGTVLSLNNVAAPHCMQVPHGPRLNCFLSTHGVANYLNIPYARIPARWRTAQPLDLADLPADSKLDATQYGPRCPQPPDPLHIVMAHMFERLSMEQYTAEFSCLTVNIYTPKDIPPETQLPVLAWIHGGAFRAGDNTTEFDGNHLVARSVALEQPIVVVTINYRLGLLGFLTSREIECEALTASESHVCNQGSNDQKLALLWIQRHIALFGGDPDRVTVAGESAGAMSVHVLLRCRTTVPLFARAVVCSSPAMAASLRPASKGQAHFDALVTAAGVSVTAPYQVKLAALRSYSADELLELHPPALAAELPTPFVDPAWLDDGEHGPLHDGVLPPADYWSRLPAWCTEIVVGTTKDELALFCATPETAALSEDAVQNKLGSVVSSDPAAPNHALLDAIWSTPALQAATTPFGRLVTFGTHLVFRGPAHAFAAAVHRQCPNHRVYLYSIDIVDPFPGTLSGFAWHSFGNAILFYQPACQRDAELARTADLVSVAHIGLLHGQASAVWEPFGVAGERISWNGSRTAMVPTGLVPSDPVREHLETLGDESLLQAYDDFASDPSRVARVALFC